MPIRHCIVHLIEKKPDGTPAVLHARSSELAPSQAIENMLAAGELARLGKHRPEWSDRTVWVYAAVTPPPRWAEHHKESLDALAGLAKGWVAETAAAPVDEPAEPVAGRVPHEQRELVP